jgi:chemotaxis signal transduction protein
MIAGTPAPRPKTTVPQEPRPVIVFEVAGRMLSIPAGEVLEIRSTDSLAGEASAFEPAEFPWVRHTIEREGALYYVVNLGALFGLARTRPTLVLFLRGAHCALLVDRIERMDAISWLFALPRAFTGKERNWYLGLALFEESVVPMLNAQGILPPEQLARLEAQAVPRLVGAVQA